MLYRFLLLSILLLGTVNGQSRGDSTPLWPEEVYEKSVPSFKDVLGYETGEKITLHKDMVRYFDALVEARPDMIRAFNYGKTWEGRDLVYYALSSADNIAKLDDYGAGARKLTDPRTTTASEAADLIETMPASLWLAYSVHGNEISGTDAAMATAYHLLAATKDDRVPQILENTIVFINPLQNPDGRDRFINRFRMALGLEADADPVSAEHNEPWPSGRTNHYLFDLNRDWISLTQPETIGHSKALQQWYPQVFVDLHEMGSNNSYYFAPEAVPYNPHLIKSQRDSLYIFGRNNAKWFDTFGLPYFTRDVYDAFYPGYGASWPAYYGAVAMTYEQASARGLKYRRTTGEEFTFRDTVFGHFVTSMATAEAVAQNRQQLLQNMYDYNTSAIDDGAKADGEARAFAFPNTYGDSKATKLATVLAAQGIEFHQLTEDDSKSCTATVGAGNLVIDASQPRARMIRTLLNDQVDMDPTFVKEQERRREKDYDHDIYDVTAWNMAMMYNVDMVTCTKLPKDLTPVSPENDWKPVDMADDTVVYLVDGAQGATEQVIANAFRAGLKAKMHTEGFAVGGKDYGRGTLIFLAKDNEGRAKDIEAAAGKAGASVDAMGATFVDSGRSLGGRAVVTLVPPKVAMAWDDATFSYSAGNSRFVIERQIGYPVTVIRTDDLRSANLSRYNVLILPEGYYGEALGQRGGANLKDWVRKGGVLIGQGRALRYLTGEKIGLLSAVREAQVREKPNDDPKLKRGLSKGLVIDGEAALNALVAPGTESPDQVPGALLNAVTDTDHWLTAGVKDELVVLARGTDIYSPLRLDQGRNAVRFVGADNLVESGYLWAENTEQLAYKPFVMVERHGRGMVIGFTHEPTVRAYLDGLRTLYGNAVLVAPSVARPLR